MNSTGFGNETLLRGAIVHVCAMQLVGCCEAGREVPLQLQRGLTTA
jgi:hypothetical protein